MVLLTLTRLETAQEIEDRPKVRENLSDSDQDRKIKEYGAGEEDLPADPDVEFDVSSKP